MALTFDLRKFNKETTNVLKDIVPDVAIPALSKTASKILNDSRNMTPVDTGLLRNSQKYEIKKDPVEPTAIIGTDVDYGVYVHEDLNAFHATGEAKFLEKALNRNVKTLRNEVKKRFRRL